MFIVSLFAHIITIYLINTRCKQCEKCEVNYYKNETFTNKFGRFIGITKETEDGRMMVCGSYYMNNGDYRHGIWNNDGHFIIGSYKDSISSFVNGEGQYYYGIKGLFKIKLKDNLFYIGEFENNTYSARGFETVSNTENFCMGYFSNGAVKCIDYCGNRKIKIKSKY